MKKSIISILCIISACAALLTGCKDDSQKTRNTPVQEPYSITQDETSPNEECPDCPEENNRELPPKHRHGNGHRRPMPKPLPAPTQPQ